MKTTIVEMREKGVCRPKGSLRGAWSYKGELEIVDTRENSYNRIMKLAILRNDKGESIKTLYSVQILWLTDDRLGLTGFERVLRDGDLVDYAQSWVCRIDSEDSGRDNEHLKPMEYNFRH